MVGWVLGIPAGPDLFHPEEASVKEFMEWKNKYKEETTYGALAEETVYNMVLSEKSKKKVSTTFFVVYIRCSTMSYTKVWMDKSPTPVFVRECIQGLQIQLG